jgi:dimethylsulfoniopropionate demethylase
MSTSGLNMSRRIRRTPYTDRVEQVGVRGYSVVNHMLLPKAFQPTVEEDYWHLRSHVQIWDVSCQRQVQIQGPHAARLVQWMTPRDIGKCAVGQCMYVPIVDDQAGLLNDPVMLKLAEDRYWLSIADSDLLLYAKGLAIGAGMDVRVDEPDVNTLAVQGPRAEDLMVDVFGLGIREVRFFRFGWFDFAGTRQLIARGGYSKPGGFEIYLDDSALAERLWDTVWAAGQKYQIAPGCPNIIDRVEAGLLSYGNEMTRENNPLEISLARYCSLDGSVDYIGRAALQAIAERGVQREIRGVLFDGGPCPTCAKPWPVMVGARKVGQVTTGIWSPRLERNIGLSLIERGFWEPGQRVEVLTVDGLVRPGELSALPFA